MKIVDKKIDVILFCVTVGIFFMLGANIAEKNNWFMDHRCMVVLTGAVVLAIVVYGIILVIRAIGLIIFPFVYWLIIISSRLCRWPILMWKAGHKKKIVISIGIIPIVISIFMLVTEYFISGEQVMWYLLGSLVWYFLWGMFVDAAIADIDNTDGFINYPKISDFKEEENDVTC